MFAAIGDLTAAADPAAVAARRKVLADAVEAVLNGGIVPVLSFAAAQVGLKDLPGDISAALTNLKKAPHDKVVAALTKVKVKALGTFAEKTGGTAPAGLLAAPVEFTVSGEKHAMWLVTLDGKPVIVRASSPAVPRKTAGELISGLFGERLATVEELKGIQALMDAALKDGTAQITDGAVAVNKNTKPLDRAKALAAIRARGADFTRDEKNVINAVKAATDTFYSEAQELVEFNKAILKASQNKDGSPGTGEDWDGWLKGLDDGKDTRGTKREPGVHTSEKDQSTHVWHAHHIAMKKGRGSAMVRDSFLARSILWTANKQTAHNELDPFLGLWNLAWAPLWSHTSKYAEDVLIRLKEFKGGTKDQIHKVLIQIAIDFNSQDARWHAKGGGIGDQ